MKQDLSRRAFCAGLSAAGAALVAPPAFSATIPAVAPDVTEVIGQIRHYRTKREDTLIDLARQANLGYVELIAANPGVDPWIPGEGTEIILPTAHILPAGPHEGILINLADMRLYYFPGGGRPIESYPIGTSRDDWSTPLGNTKVVRKSTNPTWFPTPSIRKDDPTLPARVPPGPDNPLGKFAVYLGWPAYLIHGTNKPEGVGRRVSRGCIRMYPEDIARLFPRVAIGTPVTVVYQQVKLGWRAGELLIEAHPDRAQADQMEETGTFKEAEVPELAHFVARAAGDRAELIDWDVVHRAVAQRRGIPVAVFKTNRAASTGQ